MERLHKNTQLMLEFLKGPLLILNFFYYTADTTPYCKYDQASDMWQQLELAFEDEYEYETLWTVTRSGLLILLLEKLSWFCFSILITLVLLM